MKKRWTCTRVQGGFAWAMERDYAYLCQMDADFSHDPKYLADLFNAVQTHDFAIGSRYVKSGGVADWSIGRRILSRGGSLYARMCLASPYHDQTGGFNIWKREVLETILPQTSARGYVFQVELKYRAHKQGYKGTEVPIIFADRKEGESKMDASIMKEALFSVLTLRFTQRYVEFALFACIGATGMLVNVSLFFLLADLLGVNPSLTSTLCFLITALVNYALNHSITFQKHTQNTAPSLRGAIKYLGVALGGLGINLLLLNLILFLYPLPYLVIAQAIGIAGGMLWNFLGASKFVFRQRRTNK